jgi:hypothetical protein
MVSPKVVLVVGLALAGISGALIVGFWGHIPRPGSIEQVLIPAGTVLRTQGPTRPTVAFGVPWEGGILVGAAEVDHTSVSLGVDGGVYGSSDCPAWGHYYGAAWSYSVDRFLVGGHVEWGAFCGGFANITVTQPIELLYP